MEDRLTLKTDSLIALPDDSKTLPLSGRSSSRPAVFETGFWLFVAGLPVLMLWWAFAFYPFVGSEAAHLEKSIVLARAQTVCFGLLANGLPGVQGWILLTLAPLLFFSCVAVAFHSEVKSGFRALTRSRKTQVLLIGLIATATFESRWIYGRIQKARDVEFFSQLASGGASTPEAGPFPLDYPRLNKAVPEFDLSDQNGNSIKHDSFKNKVVLLTFAFAHCQTVCPGLVAKTRQVTAELDSNKVAAVLITLDPWRDTPKDLPYLAKKWELPSNAHVLSGDVVRVTSLLDSFGVPWQRDEKTGEVAHPALIYLLDKNSKIAYGLINPSVAWLKQAATRLQNE